MIHYQLTASPYSHLFHIHMIIPEPSPTGQVLSLPNWIPGSYLIRDFARHVVSLEATAGGKKLAIVKTESNTWICEPTDQPLAIDYAIYAFDTSVRGAYLDDTRAFFNGSALFLHAQGHALPCKLTVAPFDFPAAQGWHVATTLARYNTTPEGYGEYLADSYDALIDHPVEIGVFETLTFMARGIVHKIVITGKPEGDVARLVNDVQKICEVHLDFFQEPPLFETYLFLLHVRKEGYGGLEHRSSTALQIHREAFPRKHDVGMSPEYISLLGLFSHEYFHAWMVKRIKPRVFVPYDLNHKALTEQLWAFEGITSYYDDLALLRAKVITPTQYFTILSQSITKLLRTPGRKKQTLYDASIDAWIKFYQPNENSSNTTVSYYLKGSLVALMIDLALRQESNNATSLDEVMLELWQTYGRQETGVPEKALNSLLISIGGQKIAALIDQALYTTDELPLKPLLDNMGLVLGLHAALSNDDWGGPKGAWGLTVNSVRDRIIVGQVFYGGAAMLAGINPLDEIIAVNHYRVDSASWEKINQRWAPGQSVVVHLAREDKIHTRTVTLQAPPIDTAQITLNPAMSAEQKAHLAQWLLHGF